MLKVLVVDDSALMRRRIGDILSSAGFTVATAADGAEALERLADVDPDVVTLDVTMPGMDGLACLKRIMVERPTPVVMLSALTADGAEVTLEALRLGAVEAVRKPTGVGAITGIAEELVETVRAAAGSRPRRVPGLRERLRRARERIAGADFLADARSPEPSDDAGRADDPDEGLVLIGVSTGGPRTLEDILPLLPADFPWPVVVAQHMPASFTGPLARRLDTISAVTVVEAAAATALQPGMVCIARGGADLQIVRRGGRLCAQPVPADERRNWHPNVDRLVESALRVMAPSRLIGVLLTGMGSDGAAAMTDLRRQGGRTIAEAEDSAVVFGMPQELIRLGGADMVLPSDRVAQQVKRWVMR